MTYLYCVLILFIFQLLYFKIAEYYNIIDKPNHRSLHTKPVIRGGGIIFLVGTVLYFTKLQLSPPPISSNLIPKYFFLIGLFAVGIISFLDDVFTLPNRYRLPMQFISVVLILLEFNLFQNPYWLFFALLILCVGIINAYNFMDGINGITGGYSTIILLALYWVNNYHRYFIDNEFLVILLISLSVFNFFNFRTKAKCFAGDVGSISIAFIILFLLLKISILEQNPIYIFFLTVYGIDSIATIIERLLLKENIFQAHRKHLFQLLVYKAGLSHLKVTTLYMIIQGFICITIIYNLKRTISYQFLTISFFGLTLVFLYLRVKAHYRKLG